MRWRALVAALLAASLHAPAAFAQDFTAIFSGTVEGRRVVAVNVEGAYDLSELINELKVYAAQQMTLIAYAGYRTVSESAPVAVFVDGELATFAEHPSRSASSPTIGEAITAATTVQRGARIGALCVDGSRTSTTHSGACSFSGGVKEWLYTAVATADPNKVIAAICKDFRLVVGEGSGCGNGKTLARLNVRDYAEPTPAPPPEPVVKEGIAVAPLPPAPDVETPTITNNTVEWTEREGGQVGFEWSATLTNPNAVAVRAAVTVRLRGAGGELLESREHVVALDAGETLEVNDGGAVGEEEALSADRWTFDVALAPDDVPLTGEVEPVPVDLEVDLRGEEVSLTNTGEQAIDLNGWSLVSQVGGETFVFRFFKLGAGKTVILSSGATARSMLPEIYWWTNSEVWDDAGDGAELRDPQGRVRARTNPDGSRIH